MKKTLTKDMTISYQEKTHQGFVNKSFDCPKVHVEVHLKQMQHLCYNIQVTTKKG